LVKGTFPFIFLLLQRAYAGMGRSSTSNPARPVFCNASVVPPGVGSMVARAWPFAHKKSGAQVGRAG
jgi:hypothetical protein